MKNSTLILALAVCLAGMTGQVWAADTGTITVTVSLGEVISVSLDEPAWAIGAIALDGTSSSPTCTATNGGNVAIDLKISGANGAGGWTIGSPAAADVFEVAVAVPDIKLTTGEQVLAGNVAVSGTKTIDMDYTAPSGDTKGPGIAQGFDITITATKYTP